MSYRLQIALFLKRFIFSTMDLLSYIIDSHLQQCIHFSRFHLINYLQTVLKWYTFTIPLAQRRRAAVSHYIIGYVKKKWFKKVVFIFNPVKRRPGRKPGPFHVQIRHWRRQQGRHIKSPKTV